MQEIRELVFIACVSFVVAEIIYFVTPKDKVYDSIYALLYTVIILMSVTAMSGIDLDFGEIIPEVNSYQDEIDSQINEYYKLESEKEFASLVEEALQVVHINCEEISPKISVNENNITIHSIKIVLEHKQDIDNAKIILNEFFGDEIPLEVTSEN